MPGLLEPSWRIGEVGIDVDGGVERVERVEMERAMIYRIVVKERATARGRRTRKEW